jgi:hypothetical protein
MSLYPRYYELKICPVCREQVEEDYEYGTHHHHTGYWGDIEPVAIKIPVPDRVELAISSELVQSVLKEKVRKQERRDAQMDWWHSLPQEERNRREAERRAALSPMARAMEDMLRPSRPLLDQFSRQLWTDAEVKVEPGTAIPTPKEGD